MAEGEEQVANAVSDADAINTADSGDTADILAELDELTQTSKTSADRKPKHSTTTTTTPKKSEAAPTPVPPAPTASSNTSSSNNAWSWNSLAEGLTTSLTGADVEAVMDGENADLGATKADIQDMESAIASAEEAVSSAMFSAFSSVSETLVGTSTTATKKKKTKKKGGVPVDDSDLDALTQGPSGEDANETPETSVEQPADTKESGNQTNVAAEASTSGWTSWTDSLANDTSELLTSTLPNFPVPPPIDADGNEIPQSKEEEAELPSASDAAEKAVEAASSSLWSAFSAVSDTILQVTPDDSANNTKTTAGSSNMLMQLYTSKVNQAAEWIDELENEENSKDPYKHLKQHLKDYVEENPTGTYEGWIQKWVQEQDWGEEEEDTTGLAGEKGENNSGEASTTAIAINPSYYNEESIHRTFWNEKNYADGIPVDDENALRKYVQARGTSGGKRVSQ